jgi:hypothetical protein
MVNNKGVKLERIVYSEKSHWSKHEKAIFLNDNDYYKLQFRLVKMKEGFLVFDLRNQKFYLID